MLDPSQVFLTISKKRLWPLSGRPRARSHGQRLKKAGGCCRGLPSRHKNGGRVISTAAPQQPPAIPPLFLPFSFFFLLWFLCPENSSERLSSLYK